MRNTYQFYIGHRVDDSQIEHSPQHIVEAFCGRFRREYGHEPSGITYDTQQGLWVDGSLTPIEEPTTVITYVGQDNEAHKLTHVKKCLEIGLRQNEILLTNTPTEVL